MVNQNNIIPHNHTLQKEDRIRIMGHRSGVLWFTGLSGSGKSTIANLVEKRLHQNFLVHSYLLDGDNIRKGLNKDLGFSEGDRTENIRRIGEVACLFVDAGLIVLTAFISPFRSDRQKVRNLFDAGDFIEIYIYCPLELCEKRDPKGLYRKARAGEIKDFSGISSPYEEPVSPEIRLDTSILSLDDCASEVIRYLKNHSFINI
jgi:adenylyl-sulfate kinase